MTKERGPMSSPFEEFIERELKKAAKDSAKFMKTAVRIGKEVAEIFFNEFSRELMQTELQKRKGGTDKQQPSKKKREEEDEEDED